MIRLAWRQFRVQALAVYAVLAVAAITAAITGPRLVHRYDTDVAYCRQHGNCGSVMNTFVTDFHGLQATLNTAILLLPALLGMFWGAPLVARELETGTFRLAWTQSITRDRWMLTKLAVAGLTALVATGVLSLIVTWWSSPVDQVNLNRLTPAMFGERGLAPVGYTALAVAIGVLAGVLVRRTVPAMVVTLVAFTGARLAMTYWLRPRIFSPVRTVTAFDAASGNGTAASYSGASNAANWVLSTQTINAAGHVIGTNGGIGSSGGLDFQYSNGVLSVVGLGPCPSGSLAAGAFQPGSGSRSGGVPGPRALQACLDSLHIRQVLTYQPASRYWPLQWSEMAIFLAVALLLAATCLWRVRKHT